MKSKMESEVKRKKGGRADQGMTASRSKKEYVVMGLVCSRQNPELESEFIMKEGSKSQQTITLRS